MDQRLLCRSTGTHRSPLFCLTNEPRQVAAREVTDEGPFEHAHFHFAWHVPDVRHDDIPALDVLSTLLGGGRSSRLYRQVRDTKTLGALR